MQTKSTDLKEGGDLGGFVLIQGGNKAILEPKVRPWQVTAKFNQVKPSQGQVEVPNVVGLCYKIM